MSQSDQVTLTHFFMGRGMHYFAAWRVHTLGLAEFFKLYGWGGVYTLEHDRESSGDRRLEMLARVLRGLAEVAEEHAKCVEALGEGDRNVGMCR